MHIIFLLTTWFIHHAEANDAPRFFRSNGISFGVIVTSSGVLLIFQHVRYILTNETTQEQQWNILSNSEKIFVQNDPAI